MCLNTQWGEWGVFVLGNGTLSTNRNGSSGHKLKHKKSRPKEKLFHCDGVYILQ